VHRDVVMGLAIALGAATLASNPASACSEHGSYYAPPVTYRYYAPAPAVSYYTPPVYSYYAVPPAYGYYPPAPVYGYAYDRSYDYRPPVYGYRDVGWRRW
jgi:hypothetical protein